MFGRLDMTHKGYKFHEVFGTKAYTFETKCRYRILQLFQDGALRDSCTALISIAAASVKTIVKALSNFQQNFQSIILGEDTTDMTEKCEVRSRRRKKDESTCNTSITSNPAIKVRFEVQE